MHPIILAETRGGRERPAPTSGVQGEGRSGSGQDSWLGEDAGADVGGSSKCRLSVCTDSNNIPAVSIDSNYIPTVIMYRQRQ